MRRLACLAFLLSCSGQDAPADTTTGGTTTAGDTTVPTSGNTDTTGSEPTTGAPALAPKILFRSDRDGTERLYWMNPDGSEQVAITSTVDGFLDYSWTPDGAHILYLREGDVWLLDPETSTETDVTPDHFALDLAAIAPSGQWFLFRGNPPAGGRELYRANIDGTDVLRLTKVEIDFEVHSAAISPDDAQIAYVWALSDDYLTVMAADGSDEVDLQGKLGFVEIEKVVWSPDGSELAIEALGGDDEFVQVYTVRPDGSGLKRLTTNGGLDPVWTADGSRIVLAADMGISVMNRDGTGLTPLAPMENYCFNPDLSADETQIVYNCINPDGINELDIYTLPLAGGTPVQLTKNTHDNRSPKWRP